MTRRALPLAISVCLVVLLPTLAAAQPSPFAPSPNPAPEPATPPPPPQPLVPPRTPDTTSAASPAVAGVDASAKASPRPPPTVAAKEEEEPEPPNMDVTRFAIGAGGHVAFGSAPAVALGVRASAELATGRWAFGIEGRYDLPSSGHTTQGGTARTSLVGGSLVPCLRAKSTWACGVVLVSRVTVDGADASAASAHDHVFFLGLGGRLAMHFSLPENFALRVGGEVLIHPIPYDLGVNGRTVFHSSVVSTTLGPTLVRAF